MATLTINNSWCFADTTTTTEEATTTTTTVAPAPLTCGVFFTIDGVAFEDVTTTTTT